MFLCCIGHCIYVKITWGTSLLVAMSLFNSHHLVCGNLFTPSVKYNIRLSQSFVLKVSPLIDAHLSFLPCFSISSTTRCKEAIISLHCHCCYSHAAQWHLCFQMCAVAKGNMMGLLSYRGCWVQSHCVACLILTQLASDCAVQPCSLEVTGQSVSQLNSRSCQLLNLCFQLYNFCLYLIYMRAFIVTYYAK